MIRARRRRWPWVLAAFALVAAGAGVALARRADRPKPVDPALVVTAKRAPFSVDVLEVGRVEPRDKVELKSKLAGRVARVLVREGERVRRGDVLLELDTVELRREVAQQHAELAQVKARRAHAEVEAARKRLGAEQGVLPRIDADAAAQTATLAGLELESRRIAVGGARHRLADARLRSPLAGTVIARNIEPGEMVVPGVESTFESRALLTVADLSTLLVKADLNQIDVAKARLGQRATVTLDALPGRKWSAKVTKIAPASVRRPGKELDVFPVEVELDSADAEIKPGMTADVRIHIEARESVVALPIESVVERDGQQFVNRLVDAARTERVPVVVGARNDREVEIVSGLAEGERVVVEPPSAAANETKI